MKKIIPLYDATAPIACTIGSDEVPDRIELVEQLRSYLVGLQRTEHGMLLTFPNRPEVAADVRRFAVDEKRCCEFWGFDVTERGSELVLRWDAPPDAQDLVDRLAAFFEGDEPASALGGLL